MAIRDLSDLPRGALTHDEAVSIAQAFAAAAFETIGVFRSAMGDFTLEGRYWYAGGRPVAKLDEVGIGDLMAQFVLTEQPPSPEALYLHVTARGVPLDPQGYGTLPLCVRTAYEVFVRSLPPLAGEAARAEAARRAAEEAARPRPPERRQPRIWDTPKPNARTWDKGWEDEPEVAAVAVAEPAKKANGRGARA